MPAYYKVRSLGLITATRWENIFWMVFLRLDCGIGGGGGGMAGRKVLLKHFVCLRKSSS